MVFEDHELDRPGLLEDESFAALKAEPRMLALTGRTDVSRLGRTAGWRHDLDVLAAEIRRLAPAHRKGLPAETEAVYRRLRADVPRLSDIEIYAGLNRMIASLRMGHTMMWGAGPPGSPATRMAFSYLPIQLYAFPEGLHVIRADAANADLVGARLVSMGEVRAAEALERVAAATSYASPMEALWTAPMRFGDVNLLRGLGLAALEGPVRATFELADGRRVTRDLAPGAELLRGKLGPAPGAPAPAFLGKVAESHWLEVWQASRTVYAQVNQIAPDEDESLPQFGLRLRKTLSESGARTLILDLRHNNGGNTFTYVELLRTAVAFSSVEGATVYVLIGRNVYSAAANLSTDLERLASPVFVGEPTGMTGNQDGDEGRVVLPWSGLQATVSGVRWQLSHPWDHRGSIAPRVPVQLTAADWRAGRDPALETIKAMIAAN